jgi:hypothetical protein
MNAAHIFIALAAAIPALAQTSATLARSRASFDLIVHQPYPEAARLFGPEGERAWAGSHWNPEFLHPQPAADVEGAVFTIQHGSVKAVWVSSLRDLDARHLQYVYFLPNLLVTVIDVRFQPSGAGATNVNVVYTRSALTLEGNEHVATLSRGDQAAGKEWQLALDDYLITNRQNRRP